MICQEEFPIPDTVAVVIAEKLTPYELDVLLSVTQEIEYQGGSLLGCSISALRKVLLDHEVLRRICVIHGLQTHRNFVTLIHEYNYWNLDREEIPYEYFKKYWRSVFGLEKAIYYAAKKSGTDGRYLTLIDIILREKSLTYSLHHIQIVLTGLYAGGDVSAKFRYTDRYRTFVKAQGANHFVNHNKYEPICVGCQPCRFALGVLTKQQQTTVLAKYNWHDYSRLKTLVQLSRSKQLYHALRNKDTRILRSLCPSKAELIYLLGGDESNELNDQSRRAMDAILIDRYHHDDWKYYKKEVADPLAAYSPEEKKEFLTMSASSTYKTDPAKIREIIFYEQMGYDCSSIYECIVYILLHYPKAKCHLYQPDCFLYFIPKVLPNCSEKLLRVIRLQLPLAVLGDPQMEAWVAALNL